METDSNQIRNDSNNDSWHVILHLSTFAMFVFPFGSILGPLIVWTMKKREIETIDADARQVMNFHLTWTLIPLIIVVIAVLISLVLGGGFFALLDKENMEQLSNGSIATAFMIAIIPITTMFILGICWLFEVVMSVVNAVRAGNGERAHYPFRIAFIRETGNGI